VLGTGDAAEGRAYLGSSGHIQKTGRCSSNRFVVPPEPQARGSGFLASALSPPYLRSFSTPRVTVFWSQLEFPQSPNCATATIMRVPQFAPLLGIQAVGLPELPNVLASPLLSYWTGNLYVWGSRSAGTKGPHGELNFTFEEGATQLFFYYTRCSHDPIVTSTVHFYSLSVESHNKNRKLNRPNYHHKAYICLIHKTNKSALMAYLYPMKLFWPSENHKRYVKWLKWAQSNIDKSFLSEEWK